jgi:hypothetical protein
MTFFLSVTVGLSILMTCIIVVGWIYLRYNGEKISHPWVLTDKIASFGRRKLR